MQFWLFLCCDWIRFDVQASNTLLGNTFWLHKRASENCFCLGNPKSCSSSVQPSFILFYAHNFPDFARCLPTAEGWLGGQVWFGSWFSEVKYNIASFTFSLLAAELFGLTNSDAFMTSFSQVHKHAPIQTSWMLQM